MPLSFKNEDPADVIPTKNKEHKCQTFALVDWTLTHKSTIFFSIYFYRYSVRWQHITIPCASGNWYLDTLCLDHSPSLPPPTASLPQIHRLYRSFLCCVLSRPTSPVSDSWQEAFRNCQVFRGKKQIYFKECFANEESKYFCLNQKQITIVLYFHSLTPEIESCCKGPCQMDLNCQSHPES